ncbi:MAG: tRNA uridine-5-carboxymethylaminomethyl(34) synthesis enzyme MnmG [Bdellovibrionota bacterium]
MLSNADLLVVGGGHGGVEAALAGARLGLKTVLVSLKKDDLGKMSCNPAIGGLGKGQITREIDALGGVMARAIDKAGIQFRTLNLSKGPAVRASRAQADRELYQKAITDFVETQKNLIFIEDEVIAFDTTPYNTPYNTSNNTTNNATNNTTYNKILSVTLKNNGKINIKALVITTGTFLRGILHRGDKVWEGGRVGDSPSNKLSESLLKHGINLFRLKTGTPARIKKDTIDTSRLKIQNGDANITPFSMMTEKIKREQLPCYLTSTNKKVHDIIEAAKEQSPLFNGQIKSIGPRYCPSIEDKVFRFQDKDSHTIFLEPEGYNSNLVYPNGISTSLPVEVQKDIIKNIEGLENAQIETFGYAVEYDAIDAKELLPTLEHKNIKGLYFAGQINGTSGYEEAAGQGLIAGANAALSILGKAPLILSRAEAYIGVMIDDLITNGVDEPYRMFSSRAEYRLILREDNTIFRICPIAIKHGLLKDDQKEKFLKLKKEYDKLKAICLERKISIVKDVAWLKENNYDLKVSISIKDFVKRNDVTLEKVVAYLNLEDTFHPFIILSLETEFKFEGYLARQELEIERLKKMESTKIPENFNYDDIKGLSVELRGKLKKARPISIGHAMRIPGITPAALSFIALKLKN